MELRLPLEVFPGRQATCRAVFGTWGSFPDDARKNCPFVLTAFTGGSSERIPRDDLLQNGLVGYPCSPRSKSPRSKSLLQYYSLKASVLQHSAFFIIQLSHTHMTTGKTIALTRWTLVGKVMSLLLNMLSRLVITFLPRSKYLLISWLQSPSAVILEPNKIKSVAVSIVSPSIHHEMMGLDAMILVF